MGDKPVTLSELVKLEELSRKLTIVIDAELRRQGLHGKVGFALLMFQFGENQQMTWTSNAEHKNMIEVMKEFIATNEKGDLDELGRNERWRDRQN